MIVPDLDADSILDLLDKYPSPQRIANANLASLCKIPQRTTYSAWHDGDEPQRFRHCTAVFVERRKERDCT